MIDYRQLDDLYRLKAFFDFFLDPKKLAQVQTDLATKLAELDTKMGVVNSLDKVKQYESAANTALDKKSAQINSAEAALTVKQAQFDQQQIDFSKQVKATQADLAKTQTLLNEQKDSQTARAVTLNDQAVALNNLQASLTEQQTQLAKDQTDLAVKQAKLKAIMG